jgi:replicative DNA helicase
MLAKNRNGPTGDVQLKFTREYTRFDSFSGREDPE